MRFPSLHIPPLRHLPGRLANAVVVPTLLLVVAVASAACLSDVEHSNPLDPNSNEFEEEGTVEGRATRFYPPYPPVEKAEVRLTPGPYIAESDPDGSFLFKGIPPGTYSISAVKDGFASFPDTISVSIGKATSDVRVRLNGMPIFKMYELRTVHISRWWPQEDLYFLEILAEIEDPDGVGDLAGVWVEILSNEFTRPLRETGIVGRFSLSLPDDSLPGPSLHSLQGTDLIVHAQDAVGFVTESEPKSLIRVIDKIPLAVEPQDLSNVDDGRPNLIWEDAALPFEFTYRIDVVRDEANVQTVVETITDIPSDVTSYRIETPLASGTYFWTVSVVDTFGNRSRSKEAGFVVS